MNAYKEAIMIARELGYDWFKLIDAKECDGGICGMGIDKKIRLVELRQAMEKLKTHDIKEKVDQIALYSSSEIYDKWSPQKRNFQIFMRECINWCILNKKSEILIGFY